MEGERVPPVTYLPSPPSSLFSRRAAYFYFGAKLVCVSAGVGCPLASMHACRLFSSRRGGGGGKGHVILRHSSKPHPPLQGRREAGTRGGIRFAAFFYCLHKTHPECRSTGGVGGKPNLCCYASAFCFCGQVAGRCRFMRDGRE